MRVLVPLAQNVEELEAVTVIDLMRRAGIQVDSAGLAAGPVKASRGVMLIPDTTLDLALDCEYDMLVLPGGAGTRHLREDPRIIELVQKMARQGKYLAAICAAPAVLAKAGVLAGRQACCFPGTLEAMDLPETRISLAPVVVDGNIVTSRGPGTAMDFALALIEILMGKPKRLEVESGLVRP